MPSQWSQRFRQLDSVGRQSLIDERLLGTLLDLRVPHVWNLAARNADRLQMLGRQPVAFEKKDHSLRQRPATGLRLHSRQHGP